MPSESRPVRAISIAAALSGLVLVAVAWLPLAPFESDGSSFSVGRALSDVEFLAQRPHPIGTEAAGAVREAIIDRLRRLGLEPTTQTVQVPDYFAGGGAGVPVVNVMARIAGSATTRAVALVAHYDTVPSTPGANDDTAGVAVLLEAARILGTDAGLRNDVILIFTDGEEPAPRFGSGAFVSEHPWAEDIGVVVNLEAAGGAGPSLVTALVGWRSWLAEQVSIAAPRPVAYSFLTDLVDAIGGSNTDIAPFRDRGIAGIELTYLHGSSIYHTTADVPEAVGVRSLDQQGTNALAIVRRLARSDLARVPSATEDVFFTIGPGLVLRYPAIWTTWALVTAVVMLAFELWSRSRRGPIGFGSLLRSGGVVGLVVLISALVIAVGWMVLTAVRDTLGNVESYVYLVGSILLVAFMANSILNRTERRWGERIDPAGVYLVWLLPALSALAVPGLGYLFVWPALAAMLSLLTRRGGTSRSAFWRLGWFILVAATVLILLVPAIDIFYQLAQPRPGNPDSEMPWVIAVPAILTALTATTLRTAWPRPIADSIGSVTALESQPPAIAPTTR